MPKRFCKGGDLVPENDERMGAHMTTGGVLQNNSIICGGEYVKNCFRLRPNSKQWQKLENQLTSERFGAASVVFEKEKYLWVTGGDNGQAHIESLLKSTDKVCEVKMIIVERTKV